MGAKALYLETRKKTIHELILSRDIDTIKGVLHDRNEYREYASQWQAVNLDEYVAGFEITGERYNMSDNVRKIYFYKDSRQYAIVAAVGGKYFRVEELKPDGKHKRYVDLNLKDPSIPGTFQGAARRDEWKRLTHFRMTYKKGTWKNER